MVRSYVSPLLLALGLGLSLVSLVQARITYDKSPLPRLVATVIALEPRGGAMLQTIDGALYRVMKGTGWRVGDTVECEHMMCGPQVRSCNWTVGRSRDRDGIPVSSDMHLDGSLAASAHRLHCRLHVPSARGQSPVITVEVSSQTER